MEKKIVTILKEKGLWPLPEATIIALEAHATAELDTALKRMITPKLVGQLLTAPPPPNS